MMRLAGLAGCRVAVWGFGREGRAAVAAIRARLPDLPLVLFCNAAEQAAAQAFDPALEVRTGAPDAGALAAFDVVVKSPGISAYTPALLEAQARGTRFTSGTALWFAEHAADPLAGPVIAVTGTKGKSTTTALVAHLARALGVRTALAGNIGMPLLELLEVQAALWAVELSSFQTGEAGPHALAVITSLYEEHLDWHGSRERYVEDKLRLAGAAHCLLVNATQADLVARTATHPRRRLFGLPDGWHVAAGWIRRGDQAVFAVADLPVPGAHNALNACAALASLEWLGHDAVAAAPALARFRPLPHRLQPLGEQAGFRWINDSISTTPEATLAALASAGEGPVVVIVGGHDRGLDWGGFARAVRDRSGLTVVTQGANGPRIAATLEAAGLAGRVRRTSDLAGAVTLVRSEAPAGATILLSPGAPSFDQFRDYAERGRRFAELAGFDAQVAGIEGLGIA